MSPYWDSTGHGKYLILLSISVEASSYTKLFLLFVMLQFLILMDSIWTMFQLLFLGLLMIFQLLLFGLLVMFQLLSLGPSRVMSSYVVALLFLAAMAFSQEPCENDVQILISANNAHASERKKFHLKVNATIFFYHTSNCLYLTTMFLMSKSK